MGLKHFVLTGLLLWVALPARAQEAASPPPDPLAERIDRYRDRPRAPGTWRALAGLGDPDRPDSQSYHYSSFSDADRAILARILPDQDVRPDWWYPQVGDCRVDYAIQVARARIARFGGTHPYVEQWARTQRAVFSACRRRSWERPAGERDTPPPMPLPRALATTDADVARLQRNDRAYQSASLLFYRNDPGARAAFRTIARSASPHANIARYMLLAIDAEGIDEYLTDADTAAVARRNARATAALAEARAILADPALADIHPLAQGMIGYLGYWSGTPETRAAQVRTSLDALEAPIARIRADPVAQDRYDRANADIDRLHGTFPDPAWWLNGSAPEGMYASRAMAAEARQRPLAAWLLFPRSPFEREPWALTDGRIDSWWQLSEALEAREQGPDNAPWALVRTSFEGARYDPGRWASVEMLTRDAQHGNEPALAAVATGFYHQVRTALMYPEADARDAAFQAVLAHMETWPWRESRHFNELAGDALDYLVTSGRLVEARQLRDRGLISRGRYDGNSAALLLLAEDEAHLVAELTAMPDAAPALVNLLSIDALTRLAGQTELPMESRARFARVAWTRLYAQQQQVPRALDRLMRTLNPEITASWTSRPGARPADRQLLVDVLRSPGLNILITDIGRTPRAGNAATTDEDPGLTAIDVFQHSDNNWWCAWQPDRHSLAAAATMYDSFFAGETYGRRDGLRIGGAPTALGPLLRESWLWRAQSAAEQAALAAIPSAPRLLSERAVAWRGSGPQEEALALAVRSTRYGCQRQGGHGVWSRAAWELLHARFPQSDAARRTRYWFNCAHFSRGYGCTPPRPEDELWWRRLRYGY